jgi:competence protein ComEC
MLIAFRLLPYLFGEAPLDGGELSCISCDQLREQMTNIVYKYVESPHAELLLGTTLGINRLNDVPRFNDVLISTGTIHVVVVSGYNISLVINRLLNLFKETNNFIKVFTAQILAAIYALITGFEAPVVRALLMASVVLWARYYGRRGFIPFVLLVTAGLMLIAYPGYLFELSFQLSFLATLGIVLLYSPIHKVIRRLLGSNVFAEDFSATLSAQLFVAPLLYIVLDSFTPLSVVLNTLTLWLVPILTVIGFVVVALMSLHPFAGLLASFIYTPISSLFVNLLTFFGRVFGLVV